MSLGVIPFSSIVNYAKHFLIPDTFEELYQIIKELDALYVKSMKDKADKGSNK